MRLDNVKYLDIKNIKEALKNKIGIYKRYVLEWQKVTYNTKEDGSNFLNIEKNFNNLDFEAGCIFISAKGDKNYIYIKTYLNGYNEAETEKLLKEHTRYDYDIYGNVVCVYDNIDEIKQDIKKRIQDLQGAINQMTNVYNNILDNDLIKILLTLKDKLNSNMSDEDNIIRIMLYDMA